jgi:hypothetical protein
MQFILRSDEISHFAIKERNWDIVEKMGQRSTIFLFRQCLSWGNFIETRTQLIFDLSLTSHLFSSFLPLASTENRTPLN